MKKGRSIAEQASEIENLVARHKWINGYDIPEVAEDQELLQFDITNLMITKYPLVIKDYYTSGKELGFINLKTEKQGNDLVILGPKVSTGDSYFYVDAEEQGIDEFKFENLNQDIKQREDRERREARYFARALHFHFRHLLVKIFQRGERFDRVVFHYPLGEVTLQLPAWRYD